MVAAAILAGGNGRRMGGGRDPEPVIKSFLMVEGRRIIDRQLAVLRPLFQSVVIVAGERAGFSDLAGDIQVIPDRQGPGLGPLAGLDAALAWLPAEFDAVVCVAGDMPYLATAVLQRLRDSPPADAIAVVPRLGDGAAQARPQPLCARYHRAAAEPAAAALAAGRRAMYLFLERLQQHDEGAPLVWVEESTLRALDPTLATFVNINTPADLADGPPIGG